MDCRRSSSYTSFAAHKKRKIQRARQPQRYFLRLFTIIVLTLISQGRKAKITSKSFALHVVGYYNNPANTCSGLLSAVARNIPIIANLELSTYPNQAHDERADPTQRIDAVIERLTSVREFELKRMKMRPHDVILVVDLERTSFFGNLQKIHKLTRRLLHGLKEGKIYYFRTTSKPGSHFLLMRKSIEKFNNKYEALGRGDIFCSADHYHDRRCRISPVAVHEGNASLSKVHDDHSIISHLTQLHEILHSCRGSNSELYSTWGRRLGHFWLNSPRALERSTQMKAQLSLFKDRLFSTRVNAFSAADLVQLVIAGKLSVPEEKLRQRFTNSELFLEVTRTLTHIKAITQAYTSGDDIALITEDNVKFPSNLMEQVAKLLRDAPDDWESIQLITVNQNIKYKLSQLYATQFVKWYPSHWSTAAYILKRSGMRKILEEWTTMSLDGNQGWQDTDRWVIPENIPHLANETIYYLTQSYTHTRSIIELSDRSLGSPQLNNAAMRTGLPPVRPSVQIFSPVSLMLMSTVRVSVERDVPKYYNLLLRNFKALSVGVMYSEILIFFVCTNSALVKNVKSMIDVMKLNSSLINIKVTHDLRRFNKFYFVSQAIPKMAGFERFVLMDSDMDLSGFPVTEFFELADKYTIAGSVHGNIKESLSANIGKGTRQWFKIFDSTWWQTHDPKTLFVDIVFVEQGFVYFDGAFASWFFSKILTDRHLMYHLPSGELLPRESDFGPDLLWCGAAQDWLAQKQLTDRTRGCGVTTYPIQHLDTRQIGLQAIDEEDEVSRKFKQHIEHRPLDMYAAHFPAWYKFSHQFVAIVGGKAHLSSKTQQKYLHNTEKIISRTDGE